ncbi:MAG: hypothetical protein NC432_08635 [Roseburia sp.]|nr:hypothetical protein [Roseburia sp.]MCM1097822.1 hypothetical protein [Ruminococcus flavefaciens]
MDKAQIEEVVNASFQNAFSAWAKQIEQDLYPAAFSNPYSWLRVKSSLKKNNEFLQHALIQIFTVLLADK